MAHYRKIDVQIWNDAKLVSLKPGAKLAFIFLITHPNMTSIGAMRATIPGLAAELGVTAKDFSEVFAKGLAKHDEKSLCVFLPNFMKYQAAESPNVIKNWVKQFAYVPEGLLKDEAIGSLKAYVEGMPEGFRKAFSEAMRKEYPNTVSSKQLAVSSKSPSLPSHEEDSGEIGVLTDPATGEIRGVAA